MKTFFKSIVSISLVFISVAVSAQSKKTTTKPVAKTTKTTVSPIKKQTTVKTTASTATTTSTASTPLMKKNEVEATPKQEAKTSFIPVSSPLSKLSTIGKKEKTPKATGTIPQSSFRKGSKYLGGNVSFGSSTSTSFALFGEYGVTDYLSVGGSLSMAKSSLYRTMYVGGDVTLHLSNLIHSGSIDPFIGVSGGYNSFKDKDGTVDRDRSKDPNNGLKLIGNAGVNYYISPKMIAFVSASIGIVNGSPLQYGGGIKFGL